MCVGQERPGESQPPPPEVSIPDIIETEYKEIKVSPSAPHAWPRNWAVTGRKAGFWVEGDTQYFDLTLLGTPVKIRAKPVAYEWNFGDGTKLRTTQKGRKPVRSSDPIIAHTYTKTGTYRVSVTTYFAGMYSIDGGPWLIISGQVRATSETINMTVYRFHKYLVENDCFENPDGPDCPTG